jgi:8-oxo-dGTP pyrophosphatase MutT (NUDIX family)
LINNFPLPGKEAHIRLAPHQRRADMFLDHYPPAGAKESAVLVLLFPQGSDLMDWRVLIILRNSYNGVHSAQAAFPGGKREQTDKSLAETALREAHEEMAVKIEEITTISYLSELYVPPSNFLIKPLLAVAKKEIGFIPNPREVSSYSLVPIKELNPLKAVNKRFQSPTGEWLDAPGYEYDGLFIWGATAMILSELYQLVDDAILNKVLSITYISSSKPSI